MHWIQRHILKQLTTSESCRYIDLKPENVDGNLFMYHLNQLMNDGYVIKKEKLYSLTKEGKRYVGGLSVSTGKETRLPRVFAMLFCKTENDGILLYRWSRQPYFNHVSLPFSRILYGQSVKYAAEETLKYKTNLKGTLDFAGEVSVIVEDKESVSTHYLAHIFILSDIKGDISADGLTGKPLWGRIDDFETSETVYGTKEIINLVKTVKVPFFEELNIKK
jgi:ADP-ribose pyrophosphatase YjhB (NUDIX family)